MSVNVSGVALMVLLTCAATVVDTVRGSNVKQYVVTPPLAATEMSLPQTSLIRLSKRNWGVYAASTEVNTAAIASNARTLKNACCVCVNAKKSTL